MDSHNHEWIGVVLRWYGIRWMATVLLPLLRGAADVPIGGQLVRADGNDVVLMLVTRAMSMETDR